MTTRWSDIKRQRPLTKEGQEEYRRTHLTVDVAGQVRTLRTKLGISQGELARRIGTSRPVIARLEAGGGAPSLRMLDRISDVLDADPTVRLRAGAP